MKNKIKNITDRICNCKIYECGHYIEYLNALKDDYEFTDIYEDIILNKKEIMSINFNWVDFKVFNKLFNYFFEMPKLQEIIIPAPCEMFVSNKIALLQNLKELVIGDGYNSNSRKPIYKKYKEIFGSSYRGYYIYKDKMLIFYFSDKIIISPKIKYLNITKQYLEKDTIHYLDNLPNWIEHLNLTLFIKKEYSPLNLPINLKTFNLTITSKKEQSEDYINKIKIPFGCIFNVEYTTII